MMKQEPFSADPPLLRKRNSSKALTVRGSRILLTRNCDTDGTFYLLPGGGQKFGETLHETLVREVLEETGYSVEPGRLLLVREYIGANHEFADEEGDVHQVEHIFSATLKDAVPVVQTSPDAWQTGVDWVPLEDIGEARIYPSILVKLLPGIVSGVYEGPVYLGGVN